MPSRAGVNRTAASPARVLGHSGHGSHWGERPSRWFQNFNFAGVRIVAVGQGIDSSSEQADVLMAVHGLIDHQYVKERAKKTHHGLEGRALRGMHTGGRCFGYRNVPKADGVWLEINRLEAKTVRRIFEMSAKDTH